MFPNCVSRGLVLLVAAGFLVGAAAPAMADQNPRLNWVYEGGFFKDVGNGELIVQCLEGRVAFTAMGRTHDLTAGQLLVLPAGEPHSLKGIEDSSLLVTVVG